MHRFTMEATPSPRISFRLKRSLKRVVELFSSCRPVGLEEIDNEELDSRLAVVLGMVIGSTKADK